MGSQQPKIKNPIGDALAQRIEAAINDNLPFHVYMVLPVHPEGTLNTLNIMTQLHLTMQSLVFGGDSLVNRIRRAILVAKLRAEKKMSKADATAAVAGYRIEKVVEEGKDQWMKYLTLLNLRNWDTLEKRPVTEQIYVHSKLLIADDRVAILGSANINDRSQLGDRDSELAVIVRDDEQTDVKLDGVKNDPVSANVHKLRMRLWRKLFGLMGAAAPASELEAVLDKPAAKATWEAIQKVAQSNAVAYRKAFPFLARVAGVPSSIWPTWNNETERLEFHMPFNERFWREDEVRDESFTWDANARAKESTPVGVKGFIVALPVTWTAGESNVSGMNLTLLANLGSPGGDQHGRTALAHATPDVTPETTT
jgi:phospholipase D1/2